ncbi:vta1 like domain-containing protein [Ophiocordyceps camponoti-floridani]|uniref:Vta1 like domain-containing protein n=1 Tax=Ophiocordyceps camponoti-floridani TaxID=2030778 RepID=A0A8H4Q1W8_9HYPO|nr:vta1 like domain-containing protein [Ophiocordyceps camponoti-floridani]
MATSLPSSHHHLEAGLLSTGDDEKNTSLAPPPQPPRSMSTLRRLTLAIILGLLLGLGLSLAKDYTTGPCHSSVDRAVELQDRFDTADLLRRLLHSWFPAQNLGRSPVAPPVFAGLARRQDDGTGGSNATSRASTSFQPPTSTESSSSSTPSSTQDSSSSSEPSTVTTSSSVLSSSSQASSETTSASTLAPSSRLTDPVNNLDIPDNIVFDPRGNVLFSSRYVHDERSGSIDAIVLQCSSLHAFIIIFIFVSITIYTYNFSLLFPFHTSVVVVVVVFFFFFFSVITTSFQWQTPPMTSSVSTATKDESDSPTPTQSNRRTMTTGRVSTSSAVRMTWTTTLHNGGITTLTSTSWVDVVPSETAATSSRSKEAGLQNVAPAIKVDAALFAMMAAFAGAVLLV